MRKKAQGLSLNTVIIAAIALLVLVIISVVFMGRLGWFSQESKACKNNGGKCESKCEGNDGLEESTIYQCSGNDKCCIPKVST